ncbi:MAG: polysaccharide deacetylase family protein [candidate division WOR-3 bacterium]|nr:MAG: polysaccharide deacetylase family protein [candidate division WOR-3 bacterium]
MNKDRLLEISDFKGPYRAAAAISFDYETSAVYGDIASLRSKMRGAMLNLAGKLLNHGMDLSFCYGLGYSMRRGAYHVLDVLRKYGVHATWFSTGHVLLKGNKEKDAFRVNQRLPYATELAGFTKPTTWRRFRPTFHYEPYKDYIEKPYWYCGDQAQALREYGEDIQCHTFSHPYVAMEAPDNVRLDIEDWQTVAAKNDFANAIILAFPYCGDAYRYYFDLGMKAMIGKRITGQKHEVINLPSDIVDVYKEYGIELFTRCGSKVGTITSFANYNDAGLHFMPDIAWSGCDQSVEALDRKFKEVTKNRAAVNVWMHPCNVFSAGEIANFEALVEYLLDRQRNGDVWFTTIAEMWDYYKKVMRCRLRVVSRGRKKYTVFLHNGNHALVEDLFLLSTSGRISVCGGDGNSLPTKDGIIVKRLPSGETYKLTVMVS